MEADTSLLSPIDVPDRLKALHPGEWGPLGPDDPIVPHLATNLEWPGAETASPPPSADATHWRAARFSKAVYLYRDTVSGRSVVVKFYEAKTRHSAGKHALRELEQTESARVTGLVDEPIRTIRPLGTWRGILFLEYIDGLTLADVIAVRRNRPGALAASLDQVALLLARLHRGGSQTVFAADPRPAFSRAREYLQELAHSGVLRHEQVIVTGLQRLITAKENDETLAGFVPTLCHGDATTTNFIFPPGGGVVAIDWERVNLADRASDVGRLAAEVWHSVRQQGGLGDEANQVVDSLLTAYLNAGPPAVDHATLTTRIRFYQASSTLRIARNPWVPVEERMALVAQAMGLLASSA